MARTTITTIAVTAPFELSVAIPGVVPSGVVVGAGLVVVGT